MSVTETTTITNETGSIIDVSERTLYDIDELKAGDDGIDSSAYDKALSWLYEIVDYDWWTDVLETLVDEVDAKYGIKFDHKQVSFDLERGSYVCLGKSTNVNDRVVLKAAGLDLRKRDVRQVLTDEALVIGERYGYGNAHGWIGYSMYEGWPDYVERWVSDAIDKVLEQAQDHVLDVLRAEWDYLTGEEHLTEMSRINEYTFTSRGARA